MRPKVPRFDAIDAQREQQRAIEGNIGALPEAERLATEVNQFNWDQIDKGIESQVPNYREILRKGGAAVEDFVSGRLPEDVQRLIAQRSAELATGRGTAGSQFANYSEARTLGLTSLDLIQRGLQSATAWLSAAQARRPMFNVTSMFLSPEQQIAHAVSERDKRFQHDWMKAQIDAQPSPVQEGFGQLFDWIADTASSMAVAYAGGMGGGSGGQNAPGAARGVYGGGSVSAGGAPGGVGNYAWSSGGGAPDGGSFSNYYGGGVSPFTN